MKNAPLKPLSAVMMRFGQVPSLRVRRSTVEAEISAMLRRRAKRGAACRKMKVSICIPECRFSQSPVGPSTEARAEARYEGSDAPLWTTQRGLHTPAYDARLRN